MNIRSIRAVARKEYYHLIRDFRSLYLALIIPLLLVLLFGYALSLDVEHISMAVVDHDRTPQSREFIRKLDDFRKELAALVNKHSLENDSNTPDFIIADYLADCLQAWNKAAKWRNGWNRMSPVDHDDLTRKRVDVIKSILHRQDDVNE